MRSRPLTFALLLATASIAHGSQLGSPVSEPAPEPPGTGLIVGQVVDPGSGRGVSGTIVTLSSGGAQPAPFTAPPFPPAPPNQALTTADGRFLFRGLRKGTYTIAAAKAGYLAGTYGARRPGGGSAPLEIDEGERVTDVTVPIWRWGSISGTVLDEAGEPIVGLDVRAFRRSILAGRRRFTMAGLGATDDRGQYRISGLVPGDHVVAISVSQAWVPATVSEAYRDMMQGNDPARANLLSAFMDNGLTPPLPGMPNAVQSGSMLQVLRGPAPPPVPDGAPVVAYPSTFHPAGRTLADASVLTVQSGQDRGGIDFELKPVRMTRVSGTVIGPDGPAAFIGLRLDSGADDVMLDPEAATVTDASGAFTFGSVPVGQYVLRASRVPRPSGLGTPVTIVQAGNMMISTSSQSGGPPSPPPIPSEPTLWATLPLPVGQTPVTGLTVTLQTGSRVRGRVQFDGAADRPDTTQLQRIPILVEPADGMMNLRIAPQGRFDANGEFATGGLIGGRYFIRPAGAPPGWFFKEARYEGSDLAETPIALEGRDLAGVTIVFTDRPTDLTGTVRGGEGSADDSATVLIFPADEAAWQTYGVNPRRLRSVRTTKAGTFKAVGLPAGDYSVVAVPDEMTADWQDPRVLATLARDATHVSLTDGERKTIDLRTQQRR